MQINERWRICFAWRDDEAWEVTIEDYLIREPRKQAMTKLPNIHPGEVLLEEFLRPYGLSQNALARALGVPPRRVNEIVLGRRAVTADTALRLARYFRTSERFWLGLQVDYDLEAARRSADRRMLARIQPRRSAA